MRVLFAQKDKKPHEFSSNFKLILRLKMNVQL